MKKIISTLFSLLFPIVLFAQQAPPQGINYQAVVYSSTGNQQVGVNSAGQQLLNTHPVKVTFSITTGNQGPEVYKEEHDGIFTDQYGMVSVIIGQGTQLSSGAFNQIDWSSGDMYLGVDIYVYEQLPVQSFTVSSYQKLWSVPYALYADQANYATSSGHADSSDYADLAGNGITGVTDNGDGTLTFNYLDGSSYTTPVLTGLTGPQGPAGQNGLSAYDIWLSQGNTGTEQDFINSLQGPQGTPGSQNAWSLTGNAGTNPITNFIGTTDAQDWVVKTNNSEKMRVSSFGNVGIGTNNPLDKLHVLDGGIFTESSTNLYSSYLTPGGALELYRSSNAPAGPEYNGFIDFKNNSNDDYDFRIYYTSSISPNGGLVFQSTTNGNSSSAVPRLVVKNNNGYVGIGSVSPDQLLSVNGNASKAGGGSWATFSDKRVKYDINPFDDGLDVLMRLNPVTFKYNDKSGYTDVNKTFVGFIAQDVETVAPYMVNLYDDSNGPSGLSDKRQFDESALNKILVNAVQEQQVQIEQLKKELEEMKSIVKELKKD
jgi:hypothetical protein